MREPAPPVRCTACSSPLPAGAKFCPECGHPVATPAPVESAKDIAERILSATSTLEGERKFVTVLFADLKGSTELIADRDPEEARTLLDPVLEHMCEAVEKYGGTVSQVMGDGIMALFGAPVSWEDHAVRACHAALSMQDLVRHYGDDIQRAHGVPIQIRVGLHSGEVALNVTGHGLHMSYTAVGQAVHIAARMEQMAKPGSVLATVETARLAEGYVEAHPIGPVRVKGFERPIEVVEIRRTAARGSRFDRAPARAMTPFTGRGGELGEAPWPVQRGHRRPRGPGRGRRRRSRDRQVAAGARIPAHRRPQERARARRRRARPTAAVPGTGRACTSCASTSTSARPTTSGRSRRRSPGASSRSTATPTSSARRCSRCCARCPTTTASSACR